MPEGRGEKGFRFPGRKWLQEMELGYEFLTKKDYRTETEGG